MCKKLFSGLILVVLITSIAWAEKRIAILEPTAISISKADVLSFSPTGDRQIDTLIYDSGSTSSGYYWAAGYVMSTRMTPASPCKILGGIFYTWNTTGSSPFNAEIFDWLGSTPGPQIGSSVSVPTSTSPTWRYADFSSQDINVPGEFIMAFTLLDGMAIIGFGPINNGRSWDRTPGGAWSTWNEEYFIRAVVEYTVPDTNDVGTVSIDITSPLPWNTTLAPLATVTNFGTVMETFDVTCDIEPGGYSSTENVVDLAPGDSVQVTFTPDFTFAMEDTYTVTVYTELGGDMDTSNDTLVALIATYDPGIAEDGSVIPRDFSFSTPTISRGRANITLALPVATTVELTIYDALGRLRSTLVSGRLSAGEHNIDAQFNLPAGVYFYKLNTDAGNKITEKFIITN